MSEQAVPSYENREQENRTAEARAEMRNTRLEPRSVSLIILAILATLYFMRLAEEIVLPFVLAVVLNLLLQPLKRFLSGRLRFPAALSSLLLIIALFALIGAIGAGISVPASTWIARAPEALPKLEQKLGGLQRPLGYLENGLSQIQRAFQQQQSQEQQQNQPQVIVRQSSDLSGMGLSVLSGTGAFLGELLTLVVMLFFLLWAGDSLIRSFVEIMPRFGDKRRVVEISDDIERNISGYLATITMMNAVTGTANGLQAWAFGLPNPLLWGVLAFLLNYIPILGPFTGVVIFFIVGVFTFNTIWWALLPAGAYLLIHVAEGEGITPMLVARRFTLNPVLVILSLFFWDWMWGVIGALLAVPLLAILKIVCDHVPALMPLGHVIGGGRKGGEAAA